MREESKVKTPPLYLYKNKASVSRLGQQPTTKSELPMAFLTSSSQDAQGMCSQWQTSISLGEGSGPSLGKAAKPPRMRWTFWNSSSHRVTIFPPSLSVCQAVNITTLIYNIYRCHKTERRRNCKLNSKWTQRECTLLILFKMKTDPPSIKEKYTNHAKSFGEKSGKKIKIAR